MKKRTHNPAVNRTNAPSASLQGHLPVTFALFANTTLLPIGK